MFDRPDAILARLKALLVLAAALLGGGFAAEALLYRSGLYYRLAEPESNTGAVVTALMVLEREWQPGARNVLVFGDSRVGEGVWPRRVEAQAPTLNVINLAVPGSQPRTWWYLLREVLRRGYRPHAVVFGTLYQPRPVGLTADWALDPAHAGPLLGLADARAFPAGFASPAMRERARHAVLFPALALRQDTQALLRAPLQRWRRLRSYRPGLLEALPDYGGHGARMPDAAFAPDGTVRDYAGADDAQRARIDGLVQDHRTVPDAALVSANRAYRADWFARLAALARAHDAELLLFPLPRGPYAALLPPPGAADLGASSTAPGVAMVDPGFGLALEAPAYFFDELHLNAAGRAALSEALGRELQARYGGSR